MCVCRGWGICIFYATGHLLRGGGRGGGTTREGEGQVKFTPTEAGAQKVLG